MSDSESSRTKTSASAASESTVSPLIEDRWSNNISYQHLVTSSCVGIYQLCWNPYLHDLRRLVPFLFLYNVFSIVIAYPLFYLELAMGAVTRKGLLNCWDLAPMARGVGFAMLCCCMLTAVAASAIGARCLAFLVHSAHSFLPWLHCAASAQPPCAARHRPLQPRALTPPHSFYYNFVLDIKSDGLEGGLGNVVWELAVYYIICWIFIYFIAIKRIYSYSKLVLFKDLLAVIVLLCCSVGASQLDGAGDIFRKCEWSTLFDDVQIWREAVEYSLVQMSVAQGSLAMLGVHCPKAQTLGTPSLLALAISKVTCLAASLTLAAAFSALQKDYDNKVVLPSGSSASMILWADFVARIPGSQFWSALVFFTLFVLSLTTAALLVQTMMSIFTGRSIRRVTWAFLILICLLFCFIGVITICTQGGQYLLDFLLIWPVSKPRVAIGFVMMAVTTYFYGQTAFCEDVFFAVGQYPSVFMRICWAVSPIFLLIMFAVGMTDLSSPESQAGWALVLFSIMPILVVMMIYMVFKCRVRKTILIAKKSPKISKIGSKQEDRVTSSLYTTESSECPTDYADMNIYVK